MKEHYGGILKDYERMELAGMILKRVSLVAEGADSPEYFEIVRQCLAELGNETNVALVESWFLLQLLKTMGQEVNLYRDAAGEPLAAELKYDWDGPNETFVAKNTGEYGENEIKLLRLMTTAKLNVIRRVKVPLEIYDKILNLARVAAKV
jgi:recombinational DNA repair protein (RecF pathway)